MVEAFLEQQCKEWTRGVDIGRFAYVTGSFDGDCGEAFPAPFLRMSDAVRVDRTEVTFQVLQDNPVAFTFIVAVAGSFGARDNLGKGVCEMKGASASNWNRRSGIQVVFFRASAADFVIF